MGKTFSTGLLTNGVFQDSSNNIGIGAAPSGTYKLEVTGTAKVSSTLLLGGALSGTSATFTGSGAFGSAAMSTARLTITDGTSIAAYWKATNTNVGTRDWAIITNNANFGDFAIKQGNSQGADATSGTDRLLISASGNVGIGINSTSAKLYVLGSNEVFNVAGTNAISTYTGYYYNTSTLVGYIGNGSSILTGAASSDFIFRSEGALVYAIGNSEKMRIFSSGKLQAINTIAGDVIMDLRNDSSTGYGAAIKGGSGSLYAFKVEDYVSNIRFRVDGNGGIYAPNIGAATGTAMILDGAGFLRTLSSSIRYKKDIKPIDIGLDFILSLNPVSYNLKNGDIPQVGFIAEDFPEERLVSMSMIDTQDESKGYQIESVNYAQIVAPLVKAIQEQQSIITSLQDRLDKLENK